MTPRGRSLLERAALVVFGVVIGIGCLEMTLRATAWVWLRTTQTAERPILKNARQYRILCVGESTTGDLVVRRQSYPRQLERILTRGGGVGFTVTNAGLPAKTTDTILERLPEHLDQYKPDIVVAMMGINDGESDPAFQVEGRLRVWKLVKMLYYTWWSPRTAIAPGASDLLLLSGQAAWQQIIDGHQAEAEVLLRPLVEQEEWSVAKSRADGMMAVLNWQRGDDREAERYHQRFLEAERHLPRTRTVRNYQRMRRMLADRSIPLIAVQYPALPLDMLKRIVGDDAGVTFVDNEEIFLQAIKDRPAREIYRDLFAGIFGHMTPYGYGLLAENVARGVRGLLADQQRQPDAVPAS